MKLSDYVINFIADKGVTHVFGMSGGAAVHLLDSVNKSKRVDFICSQHEQSAAMSADGYARISGKMGVAITTSGPGATNLLTGTCCSFFDSVPTLMLTGQVSTRRLKRDLPIRQLGFQETDVISIFKSVTKFAAQLQRPEDILLLLEEAWYWAFEGRPGTVLIDLPDDLQRADIEPFKLVRFKPKIKKIDTEQNDWEIGKLIEMLGNAHRPALILGGGLSTPRMFNELSELINSLQIPVLQTWAGLDLLASDHPLRVGPFGVYGPRLGNFVVQNSDLLICLGTRLSQNVTGGILESFAREAKIIMVDVDRGELDKFDGRGIEVCTRICMRLEEFVPKFSNLLAQVKKPEIQEWLEKISHWRRVFLEDYSEPVKKYPGSVDANDFIQKLSKVLPKNEKIFIDTGGNLTWTCNGIKIQSGQRLISAWNNTPMGYSLPASIGASVLGGASKVTCIIGDGGLMICLSELATLLRYQLPIRVFVFDNEGHGIQKQTLETWLQSNYVGVDSKSGLSFPPIGATARAMGLSVIEIRETDKIADQLKQVYEINGPVICNVSISPDQRLFPVVKFGSPLEDQLPFLPLGILSQEMIVPLIDRLVESKDESPGI